MHDMTAHVVATPLTIISVSNFFRQTIGKLDWETDVIA